MKTLTLFRHAKSNWQYDLEDIYRPLNARGYKQAQFMAQHCELPPPDIIVSSPACRSYSTALFYLQAYDLSLTSLVLSADLYQKSWQHQLSWLKTLSNNIQHVWLFGHNPDLADLADVLLNIKGYCGADNQSANLATAAYMHLNLSILTWTALHDGSAELIYFRRPNKKPIR